MFVAAHEGEGASTVSREFARIAAATSDKPVWLIDLDIPGRAQAEAIAAEPDLYGALGRPAAASPDGSMFFTVQPPSRDPGGRPIPDARFLTVQSVGGRRLWVTGFRDEVLAPGQRVHLQPDGRYWRALSQHAALVVVDAPPLSRSQACLTVAPHADFAILVVAADEPDTSGPAELRAAIEATGGRCAGVVLNRATLETPRFLRAWSA
jgi:hypothetical protein